LNSRVPGSVDHAQIFVRWGQVSLFWELGVWMALGLFTELSVFSLLALFLRVIQTRMELVRGKLDAPPLHGRIVGLLVVRWIALGAWVDFWKRGSLEVRGGLPFATLIAVCLVFWDTLRCGVYVKQYEKIWIREPRAFEQKLVRWRKRKAFFAQRILRSGSKREVPVSSQASMNRSVG